MSVELRDLRWAIVASQHRSLRQASEALNVRQSTLSRRLRDLEYRVGVMLFERSTGGTRPTAAGREFLASARRILDEVDDVATLFKHLKFADVTIVTLAEGEITELHVGLKGTMNALFLKDLSAKTHRGLRGRVEGGKSGGGLCYGYKVVKKFDANGEQIRGDREIIPEEAAVIRRIFREFAAGKSPKAIAVDLNKEGIPGPLGRAWGDTSSGAMSVVAPASSTTSFTPGC